uniref:Uncharacterized protein n=1 Tax=Chaetoceros debilis TaxID=122233 RepID=A0A6S8U2X0_9STRA|mmetsp:Transcript_15252/g.22846  ORF Transcript_15252/g.22846 Transcript_15252/m.22846 type:complete len:453 (+) Transcript_15252:181-1539(+)|eukprot:CAMPEP_0194100696 /NCGR_PEP_ID=MMETSP0150-20130528/1471_1 /TAXON_ID=122233 /ORGANISM="Chaetoceros debilis, Strain MM31A-1" /LENGTH=452 /DNA_ID=CAMNT_0038787101 /DNA_START=90 /DNA_END=1448 /DNA_ORIENTATION=-
MAEDKKKDPWVVVSEFYPTDQDLQDEVATLQSFSSKYDIEGPKKGFEKWEEAVNHARQIRSSSCWFEGWDELYECCEDSEKYKDDDDEDEDEEEEYSDEPELPWCSSDLENYDNDEEQVIYVVLLSNYNAEIERRNNVLREAWEEHQKKEEKAKEAKSEKLKRAGRVYYSFPPPPRGVDIPADMEIILIDGKIFDAPREDQLEFKDDGTLEPLPLSRLAFCTSIQMRIAGLNRRTEECDLLIVQKQTEGIFETCTELIELHWLGASHISRIIGDESGPHAKKFMKNRVKTLALPCSFHFDPDDLMALKSCKSLERLDLRNSFDMELGIHHHFGFGLGIGDDSDDGEQGELPYTEAFSYIVENCMGLKYIDLEGLRSDVDNISLMEYTLDSDALQHARCNGVNVKILETDTDENGTSDEDDDDDEDSDYESEDFTEEEIRDALVRIFGLQLRG